jgi:hypothetical protein
MIHIGGAQHIDHAIGQQNAEEIAVGARMAGGETHQREQRDQTVLDVEHAGEQLGIGRIGARQRREREDMREEQQPQRAGQQGIDDAHRQAFVLRAGGGEDDRHAIDHEEHQADAGIALIMAERKMHQRIGHHPARPDAQGQRQHGPALNTADARAFMAGLRRDQGKRHQTGERDDRRHAARQKRHGDVPEDKDRGAKPKRRPERAQGAGGGLSAL